VLVVILLPGDADEYLMKGEYVQQHVIDILEGFIPKRIWEQW